MTKTFTEIAAGLDDAIAHAKRDTSSVVEHRPAEVDVKAIREKTGMSRQQFCAAFGVSPLLI